MGRRGGWLIGLAVLVLAGVAAVLFRDSPERPAPRPPESAQAEEDSPPAPAVVPAPVERAGDGPFDLVGRVVHADDRPFLGTVSADGAVGRTDAEGRFTLRGLIPRYGLWIGFGNQAVFAQDVRPGPGVLRLRPTEAGRVRIRGGAGARWEDVELRGPGLRISLQQRYDLPGEYAARAVPPGEWEIVARPADGGAPIVRPGKETSLRHDISDK